VQLTCFLAHEASSEARTGDAIERSTIFKRRMPLQTELCLIYDKKPKKSLDARQALLWGADCGAAPSKTVQK